MASGSKRIDKPWQSLTAGLVAGAIEGFVTYPAEMTKTACQFSAKQGVPVSPIAVMKTTFQKSGIAGFYSGCGALVVGNAGKAGVRFLSYDSIKGVLRDPITGKLSTPNSILAGMVAGACEAMFAVTPSETIKTKLIDDARRSTPRFTSSMSGTSIILREEGIAGLYRGLFPTIVKQASNSAVRFTSYNALVDLMRTQTGNKGKLPGTLTFLCGAGAGVITVYTTMPFDVIKTRMQSLEASKLYKNSFDCFRKVVAADGVGALWGGSVARLSRLMFSGGIVFMIVEEITSLFHKMGDRKALGNSTRLH